MHLEKDQKLLVFFFTVFVLSGLGFGLYQIYNTIYGPVKDAKDANSFSKVVEENREQSLYYFLSLQRRDTDEDGLTDYDEIYTYSTSPYLADTDSDGVNDLEELKQGDDPTCHRDLDCGGETVVAPSSPINNFIPPEPNTSSLEKGALDQLPADLSVEDLRKLLQENGFSKNQLDVFSDKEILEIWDKVFGG